MSAPETLYQFGEFCLDMTRRTLLKSDKQARLSARAIDILITLVTHRSRVVSKSELFDIVWPKRVVEENNLQVHISTLRKLLGPQCIATIPGRGYQFVAALNGESANPTPVLPSAQAPTRRTNLPSMRPVLIGRDEELLRLRFGIATGMITSIVGPGGVGKTQLALAAAIDSLDHFEHGVWMIDLSEVTDPNAVALNTAKRLDIQVKPDMDPDTLIAEALRHQRLLILLDNCEHLIGAVAAMVETVCLRAPSVRWLVTSQEPLKITHEQVLRLAPLALPNQQESELTVGQATRTSAIQLFVARAHALDRNFELSRANVTTVVDICQQLDGMPLAIELAAARLPALGLQGLHDHLVDRFQVLRGGNRNSPERQRTLLSALQWSHALLSPQERTVLRRLGVCVGGFSLELAKQVAADENLDEWTVIDALAALVEKSFVLAQGEHSLRYRMLDSTRSFAVEELKKSGEDLSIRHRHLRAIADLLVRFDRLVSEQVNFGALVKVVEPGIDNIRAAAAFGIANQLDADAVIQVTACSDWIWLELDRTAEGFELAQLARPMLGKVTDQTITARFRLAWAGLARSRARPGAEWLDDQRRAVEEYRTLDDPVGLYRALCGLGGVNRDLLEEGEAGALLAEAGRLEQTNWSPRIRMRLQNALEWWHDLSGRFNECRQAGQRSVVLARQAGSISEIGSLTNLADTEQALGNGDRAIELCRQAIERAQELGKPGVALHAYSNMVPALLERGALIDAANAIAEGRKVYVRRLGTAHVMLVPLALLLAKLNEPIRAAQVLGCAESLFATQRYALHPPERRMRESIDNLLAAALSADQITAHLKQGTLLDEDAAFELGNLPLTD